MIEQTKIVPTRRFKEFKNNQEWEQHKLSDLCSMHARIGWQNLRTSEFLDTGDYYLITGTDFDNGRVNLNSCHYVEKDRYEQDPKIQIDNGNILITKDGTLGKVAFVDGLDKPATLNAGVFNVKIKSENVDGKYLYQYLKAPFLMNYVSKNATGGTIKHLNQNILVDFPVILPKIEEQKLLGEFFQKLDDLIILQQRKLEKTKALKDAYLSEMFPAEGEVVPKRRFSGFTQDWQVKKLGELAESFEYGLNASATLFDGINKYIRITDIDDKTRIFNQSTLTSPDSNLSNAENYLLKEGDILFARTGASVGKTYQYKESDGKVYYAGFLIRARINSNFDSEFVFQSTLTKQYNNFVKITSQRSGQPGINAQEYSQFELMVPTFEEQKKISTFFKSLDNIISFNKCKLEKLQNLKKAYLTEMFV